MKNHSAGSILDSCTKKFQMKIDPRLRYTPPGGLQTITKKKKEEWLNTWMGKDVPFCPNEKNYNMQMWGLYINA